MVKYQIYIGQDGDWHWRLKAANGQIVCWSEGYSSKQAAEDSVEWVRIHAQPAPIEYI